MWRVRGVSYGASVDLTPFTKLLGCLTHNSPVAVVCPGRFDGGVAVMNSRHEQLRRNPRGR
jgi:hypothetical protein